MEVAGYRYPIHYYGFRRCVANEANRMLKFPLYLLQLVANYECLLAGHFTERERNRILGHHRSAVFEKYYHDSCIRRDSQNVVLLRPSQENLCRAASQRDRHRDHLALFDLTDDQLKDIRNLDHIQRPREQILALKNEVRVVHGTLKKARHADPARHGGHEVVIEELATVRSLYRREKKVEFRADYFDTMPGMEIVKQIDQLQGKSSDVDSADTTTDTWTPPVPESPFVGSARIADAFSGPEAELTAGEKTLTRRIPVVSELATLCSLREQSRRGKPFNWSKVEEVGEDTKTIKPSPPSPLASPRPSSDQYPFCFFDDSLPVANPMRP